MFYFEFEMCFFFFFYLETSTKTVLISHEIANITKHDRVVRLRITASLSREYKALTAVTLSRLFVC